MRRSVCMTAALALVGVLAVPVQAAPTASAQIVFRSANSDGEFTRLQGASVSGEVLVSVVPAKKMKAASFAIAGDPQLRALRPSTPISARMDTRSLRTGVNRLEARVILANGSERYVRAAFFVRRPGADEMIDTTAPRPYPDRAVAVYYMMWADSTSPPLRQLPPEVNVVNLAFAQGDPPTLVGWTRAGKATFLADAAALRARGTRFVLSIGGAGGAVNTQRRAAFVEGVERLHEELPLDGIDWDIEGSRLRVGDVVQISLALRQRLGKNFAVTMAPNGSNVDQYLEAARLLAASGSLTMYGQQFYDAPVTVSAARTRLEQAVAAGIPESKLAVGMMLGSGPNYWTLGQARSNFSALTRDYPELRGAYLWESSRPGTAEWSRSVAKTLSDL